MTEIWLTKMEQKEADLEHNYTFPAERIKIK